MSAEEKALCAAVCRDLLALAGRVRVTLDDGGRMLPVLSSQDLWRILPRLIGRVCDLADAICADSPQSLGDTVKMRALADLIDGRKGRVTA